MKANLELNISDEMAFLNFWDSRSGDDVICEIVDGKLMLVQYADDGDQLPPKEIGVSEFVGMVKARIDAE